MRNVFGTLDDGGGLVDDGPDGPAGAQAVIASNNAQMDVMALVFLFIARV
jgi:hypothetical protein